MWCGHESKAHLVDITIDRKYLPQRVEEDECEEEVGARDQILGVENLIRLHVACATSRTGLHRVKRLHVKRHGVDRVSTCVLQDRGADHGARQRQSIRLQVGG